MNKDCLDDDMGIDQKGIFNFNIGLVDSFSKLNCSINVHEKSFRYFKSKKPIFTILDPLKKLKKIAFQRIFSHSHSKLHPSASCFLPAELYRGNQSILPSFLPRLKKEKVDSFIKLNFTPKSKILPQKPSQDTHSNFSPRRYKSLNIYYTKIHLNPEQKIKKNRKDQRIQYKTKRFLVLNIMKPSLDYKFYRFQSVDSICWKKKIIPKTTL